MTADPFISLHKDPRAQPDANINIFYANTHLHFKNFAPKLGFLAMLNSFTGRITATLLLVVVIIIGVVVTVPV